MNKIERALAVESNWYMLHTTINMKEHATLETLIDAVEGVDRIDRFGTYKYEVEIKIGRAFDVEEVVANVLKVVNEFQMAIV